MGVGIGIMIRLVVALLPLLALTGAHKSYDGYKVLRTSYLDETKAKALWDLMVTSGLDFWKEPRVGRNADISVPPERLVWVKEWLTSHDITFHTMIENLKPLMPKPTQHSSLEMNWDDYQDHDTLNAFIDGLASANSGWARIENIGKSYEGRDMNVLCLERAGPGKPNIWLEAGIHAREWIAPAVATYIVNELVNNDADHPEYLANISDYVLKLDPMPVLGHCFHSYSQLWLWPYGYAYNVYPDNWQEIEQLAIDASDALFDVHGTYFEPENSASLYPAAGASDDWYKSIGMRYSFTTELRATGRYGFELPKEQIKPSGAEMWAAFKVVIDRVQQK